MFSQKLKKRKYQQVDPTRIQVQYIVDVHLPFEKITEQTNPIRIQKDLTEQFCSITQKYSRKKMLINQNKHQHMSQQQENQDYYGGDKEFYQKQRKKFYYQ